MSERGQHLRLIEALLFASSGPVEEKALGERLPQGSDVRGLLLELQSLYAGRGVNLVRVGPSWAFRTAPDLGHHLKTERRVERKLSRAAVETLAIIAYHQPVSRAEIEEIRGVAQSKGTLDVLLEAGWIRPGRRRQTPGRPVTWLTTQHFLEHFSLESIDQLPGIEELRASGLLDARPAIQAFRGESGELPTEAPEDLEDDPLVAEEPLEADREPPEERGQVVSITGQRRRD